MKEEIRRELAAGKTEEEILAAYEARYGIQILAEPPPVGFQRLLYAAPLVALFAGVLVLSALLIRWRRRGKASEAANRVPPSTETLELIERELAAR